jgi:hypothetical protein
MRLSVMPSLRYSVSGSPLAFAKDRNSNGVNARRACHREEPGKLFTL